MTQEYELDNKLDKPDFLVIAGSRMYGTNTNESDYDYRGFVVPPFEYLSGLSSFKHHVVQQPDIVIYSLKRFFELLILGDPTAYEILFAPEANVTQRTRIGSIIILNRELFACRQFAARIGGYAQSEWRKVTGTQLVPIKRTPNEDEVIEDIRRVFHPQKEEMDEIIRLLLLQHRREIRSARRKLGAKRKAQIERYGYCTSSACHTIRLLGQLTELMNTGKLTFPRPDTERLLLIKRGSLPLKEVTDIYNTVLAESISAESQTYLPDNAPVKLIKTLYNEIIAHVLSTDQRVKSYANSYFSRWGKS